MTDSSDHFIRGSLYFNHAPNPDSTAPVVAKMMGDIEPSNEIDIVGVTWIVERGNTLWKVGTFEDDELVSKISFEEFSSEALPKKHLQSSC